MSDWLNSLAAGGINTAAGTPQSGGATPAINIDDIVTKLGDGNRLLGKLVQALNDLSPRTTNSFTMDAAASTVVTDANVASSSFVVLSPMNAQAGNLIKNEGVYWVVTSGSFTVSTSSGSSAGGDEAFAYAVFTSLG